MTTRTYTRMTPLEAVEAIRTKARQAGVAVSASETTLVATVRFTPGDVDAYVTAENACNDVLRLARQTRPGSTWGTTSDGTGGQVGLRGGYCTINRSGVDKRVLKHFR